MGDKEGARVQLDLVMSGKPLEVNSAGRKVRICYGSSTLEGPLTSFFFFLPRFCFFAGQVQFRGTPLPPRPLVAYLSLVPY